MASLIRWSDDILTAALLAAAAGAVLAVLAFSTSVHRSSSRSTDYTHKGTWSYQAPVPDDSLYADGKVRTGEPIFSALSQEATFTFSYSGASAEPADVVGTGRLTAELRESSGWTWDIPLSPTVRFQGPAVILAGRLDLVDVATVVQRFKQGTGVGRTVFELAVRADVDASVTIAGNTAPARFEPTLVFRYDAQSLIPIAAGSDPNPSQAQAMQQQVRVGNTIPLLAWRMDVGRARMLGLSLLEVAVLALILVVVARMDPRSASPSRPVLDERQVVTVGSFPTAAGTRTVDVGSLEELARIAEFEQAMVLTKRELGTTEYAVVGVGAIYIFRDVEVVHRRRVAA